ncbi:tape measure protein [Winkia sp. UMB3158]|uniref:Tape measure protein n=43 Tax=Bacillati TaxID=1783272 RepID=A0AB38XRK4_9ACTO|nr:MULTISPECIES: tape measure protein [Terrabacteria group]MDK8341210.1 tape measure protein [Winkia sp. UMB3164B]MDK6240164.1 tape measure protein [Winkia sp. UMB10116]MDK6471386.1 tape measure protein [Streptococcus agalactiae]MDK7148601.1 tape measure protein [Winkia sp. UMB3158]MDK7163185.1 tape measure protein [Winkia sp. UMB3105]
MAFNVGTLTATLEIDDSKFKQGLNSAEQGFKKTGEAASQAGQKAGEAAGQAGEAAKAAGQAGEATEKTANRASTAMGKLKSVGKVTAAAFTATAGIAGTLTAKIVRQGVAFNALEQGSRAALKTFLGDAGKVNKQMEQLNDLVQQSPFSKGAFIQGQQQLLAFGMEAKKVVPTLKAIQDAVAAAGGSSQQLSDVTFVLAQIQAAGKITGQDLMQLGQRGINAAELIGSQMGKTGAQIRQEISNGSLDATKAIDMLVAGMSEKFGGAAANVKQTWEGATQRVSAQVRNLGANLTKYLVRPTGGGDLVKFIGAVGDTLATTAKQADRFANLTHTRVSKVFDGMTNAVREVNKSVATFDLSKITGAVDQLAGKGPAIAGFAASFATIGLKSVPGLNMLLGGINPLIPAIGAIIAASPKLRQGLGEAFKAAAPAGQALGQLAVIVADLGTKLINAAAPGLTALAKAGAELLNHSIPLAVSLAQMTEAFVPLVTAASKVVELFTKLPEPIQAGILAMGLMRGHTQGLVDAFGGMVGKLTSITGAFKGSVSGLSGSLKSVGGAIMGAFGGPVGLAVGAVAALAGVIGTFYLNQQKANKETADFAHELNQAAAAADGSAQKLVANKAQQDGMFEAISRVNRANKDANLTTQELTAAMAGNGDEAKRLVERYQQLLDARIKSLQGMDPQAIEHDPQVRALRELIDWTNKTVEARDKDAKKAKEQKDAVTDNTEALKKETQAQMENASQKRAAIDAAYALQDAQDKVNQAVSNGARIQKDANGQIDITSAANRKAIEPLSSMIDAYNRQLEQLQKTGHSQQELNEKINAGRNSFLQAAQAMGLNKAEAEQLATQLGMMKDIKAIDVKVRVGVGKAKKDISLLEVFAAAPVDKPINATTNEAKNAIDRLNILAEKGVIKPIDANTLKAMAKDGTLNKLIEQNRVKPIDANTIKAMAKDGQLNNHIKQVVTKPIHGDASHGHAQVRNLNQAGRAKVSKPVDVHQARNWGATLQGWWNSIKTTFSAVVGIETKLSRHANGDILLPYAAGGMVKYFASGGRESHVAQIAPAGAWRVWAEPETGGESYIPLARSKRKRSTQILAETADMFGYNLVAKPKKFADGRGPGGPYENPGGVTQIFNMDIKLNSDRLPNQDETDEFGRALMWYLKGNTLASNQIVRSI